MKTPMGKVFKPNNVHSIYKKGKIRGERLNSKVKVEKEMFVKHYRNDEVKIYLKWKTQLEMING